MPPELIVLVAAAMVALKLLSLGVQRVIRDELPQAALLALVLAVLVVVRGTHREQSMLAFVAAAMAAVLTLLPRLFESIERRALQREEFVRALRVARLHEVVVPGRASFRRRRQLEDLADVCAGRVEPALARLESEIARRAPADAAPLHEERIMVLLLDRRSPIAVDQFERHLGISYAAERPRLALYLLRAYGEVGRIDRAAQMLTLIEESAARDPLGGGLVGEARLWFLAHAGRARELDELLAKSPGRALHPRAQAVLREVVSRRAGQPLPDGVASLADAAFARASVPSPAKSRPRAPVTLALIALNLAAMTVALVANPTADEVSLIRSGALFRPAVLGGEWWRGASAMFLHAGWVHLGINMYGLWLLGRFTEELFGPARFFLAYLAGGLVGALASTLVGAGALSVGASGAIMGILGALIVTLILRRGSWPEAWRRALLANLLLLSALQIYIGFEVAMIDNAAHVGGMIGGAAAAALIAPGGLVSTGRAARIALAALSVACALALGGAGVCVVRTPLERTLARVPTHTVELAGVRLDLPRYWELDVEHGKAEDPFLGLKLTASLSGGAPRIDFDDASEGRTQALTQRIRRSAVRAGP